jgi:pimeloyl-ACP methyl ester carboxylesterase
MARLRRLRAIHDTAPGAGAERVMLVMLPGAGDRPEDLVAHGFIRALRQRRLPVDVAAVDAHMGYYLERSIVEHLAADIIVPAQAQRRERLWLMGISLGGTGAVAYAREHGDGVEGVVLIAPFLGTRGLIAEVERAGGLSRWRPGNAHAHDDERALVAWLKDYRPDDPVLPKIYLGYGTEDRLVPASAMLAQRLPAGRVARVGGGHDWRTWLAVWERLLDGDPFFDDRQRTRTGCG